MLLALFLHSLLATLVLCDSVRHAADAYYVNLRLHASDGKQDSRTLRSGHNGTGLQKLGQLLYGKIKQVFSDGGSIPIWVSSNFLCLHAYGRCIWILVKQALT
jgi:hypothetical protein